MFSKILIAFAVVIAAVLLIYGLNIKREKNIHTKKQNPTIIADKSIYQFNSEWKNQDGNLIKLKSFRGKKIVLAMFYASCTTACPVLVNDLKKLEAAIPAAALHEYRFILISIDPLKDIPVKLKEYASIHNLEESHWTLLTGSRQDVDILAQLIGFQYRKNPGGMYSHTNLITYINENGEIVNQITGLNTDTKKMLSLLNK